ncbi:hypothetical protein B0T17DRAFT_613843 [Bombardia bombarda]|uniref:Uncharacterized protein n=1 Tax=Bombardia bombarda TaxID=252184 RepID=A0AA39XP77_9PEZI|nr:hypothetical protein B0T17DRAFT_613843 [Bombardia bombarda]
MANNQVQPAAKDSGEEEKRIEDGLEHLKELHLQLRALRSALPRMFEPLATKQPSPQVMFAGFSQSVKNTKDEIDRFRQAMNTEETQAVIKRANDSRRLNPVGIKPWRARDDPEWTAPKRRKTQQSATDAEWR